MLIIANRLKDLDFRALMDIYIEGNVENGQDNWPDLPMGQQLIRAEQDFYQYLNEQFFSVPGAFYALWQQGKQPVSALRMEPYQDGWLLEALETKPEVREKGYATMLIKAVVSYLGQEKVFSHVSRSNRPSMAVHTKCGFEKILDHAVYLDGSVNAKAVTLCLNISGENQ